MLKDSSREDPSPRTETGSSLKDSSRDDPSPGAGLEADAGDLLSDEAANRQVLRWVKEWDELVRFKDEARLEMARTGMVVSSLHAELKQARAEADKSRAQLETVQSQMHFSARAAVRLEDKLPHSIRSFV